ncbi:MAG TPA: helix-turn-helix transcriptional regulator [Pirellulales bacterium]|nr:helix-turn-helix transcriptional regulator [Pirellulales bacterium]
MKKKPFQSVSQMIETLSENPDFIKATKTDAAERELVSRLFALRCANGVSQEEMAKELGCSQGRISKLESTTDRKLRLGDVAEYAAALDMELRVVLAPKRATIADEVKYHWACVKRLLDSLVDLAKQDQTIAGGISRFFGEAAVNFLSAILGATAKLQRRAKCDRGIPVDVVSVDDTARPSQRRNRVPH